jgi:hypothetical protein
MPVGQYLTSINRQHRRPRYRLLVVLLGHCLSVPARPRPRSSLSGQASYTDGLTLPVPADFSSAVQSRVSTRPGPPWGRAVGGALTPSSGGSYALSATVKSEIGRRSGTGPNPKRQGSAETTHLSGSIHLLSPVPASLIGGYARFRCIGFTFRGAVSAGAVLGAVAWLWRRDWRAGRLVADAVTWRRRSCGPPRLPRSRPARAGSDS